MPVISEIENYHGLNDDLTQESINYHEDTFEVRFIPNKKRKELINTYCTDDYVVGEIKRIQDLFVAEYLKINGKNPAEEIIARFSVEMFFGGDVSSTFELLSDERLLEVIERYKKI